MLATGRPGFVPVALATVGVCLFLMHEPLLVLLGARGSRAAREQRVKAWRFVMLFGGAAIVLGLPAVRLAPPSARFALIIPAVLATVLSTAIVGGRERTIAGELLAALTLASFAVPVGLGAGIPPGATITCAAVYAFAFGSATIGVHAVISHQRQPPATAMRSAAVIAALSSIGTLGWLAARATLAPVAPWAAGPSCVGVLVLALRPPTARQLRIVGWLLVASSTLTAVILIVALR